MCSKPYTLLVIAAALLIPTLSTAAGSKSEFEGTSSYLGLTVPGTWTCPGGDAVPPFSCPPGSRTRLRGAATAANFLSPATGPASLAIVVNANYAADYTGEMWGSWTIAFTGAGSTCEGSWTGSVRKAGNEYVNLVRAIAFCTGGEFDGSQLKWTETATGFPAPSSSTVTGRFLDPRDE